MLFSSAPYEYNIPVPPGKPIAFTAPVRERLPPRRASAYTPLFEQAAAGAGF